MIADALKKALLQAAIQGKLTEQLPEDGDARDLLKEIQKEKARLIKEGKIKKEKPLPEIKEDEIPFNIPENWVWVRLGVISSRVSAGGDKPKQFSTNRTNLFNIPVISNGEQNEGFFGYTDKPVITETSITISGRGTIGYSCVRNYPYFPIVRLISVTPISSVNPYYLKHVFSSLLESGVGTSIQQLTIPMIVPKLIPLPPLSEQQRIVAKVEELLLEIDVLKEEENKLDNLEKAFPGKIRASILQAAIQGKLTEQLPEDGDARDLLKEIQKEKARLIKEGKIKKEKPLPEITEDEIPFDIPDNWRWVRFGDLFSIGSSRRVHERDWRSAGIPFYRAREIAILADQGHINNELFIDDSLFEKFKSGSGVPQAGDLMVTGVGTLGKTYIVKETDKFYYKDACVLCVSLIGTVNSQYIKYFIESSYMREQINSNSSGTTVATLTISRFGKYLFALPPLSEQNRIVEQLENLLPLCNALE